MGGDIDLVTGKPVKNKERELLVALTPEEKRAQKEARAAEMAATMSLNSGLSEAPPTRKPSTSGHAESSGAFFACAQRMTQSVRGTSVQRSGLA